MKKAPIITIILLLLVLNISAQDNTTWRGPQRDGIYPSCIQDDCAACYQIRRAGSHRSGICAFVP